MNRFLTAIGLCMLLLTLGLFVFLPGSQAQDNVLEKLLKLPAPPPPNPDFQPQPPERPEDFYDQRKPPKDDAPIEDLMEYWQRQNQVDRTRNYNIKPSDKVLARIKSEIENDPEKLLQYLNTFANDEDGAEFVKRLYDAELVNRKFDREWRAAVKNWLTYNSPYFSNELLRTAQLVKDENDYVTNQQELLALAKVDWRQAEPLLDKLLNDNSQPVSQTLARWAFYQHALDTDNKSDAEKYRKQLQATVENKNEKPGNRDLAMDALVRGGDFEGRDEWYLKLLEDETLHNLQINGQTYTGLTSMIMHSPADKYTDRMIELLKSDSKAVRSAAIRNFAFNGTINNEQVVRLLLPWLDDPNWATDVNNSRRALISALKGFYLPESVPGLLAVLSEKDLRRIAVPDNVNSVKTGNSNTAVSNENYQSVWEARYLVSEAVQALGKQKDARAIPALRVVMTELESWQKQYAVDALLKCGGFSVSEQVEAVESAARGNYQRDEEIRKMSNTGNSNITAVSNMANLPVNTIPVRINDPEEIKMLLGNVLTGAEDPSNELVTALVGRINVLEKREPGIARAIRDIMRNWKGTAVNALLLRNLRNNKAEIPDILKLLVRRKELRDKQINDIYDTRGGAALAVGLSACLLEQNSEYDAILDGENIEAKTAMLACARLIRAKLPVQNVARYLQSTDKMLSTAAEEYLESEDSPEARAFVLALYPNKAKIFGARSYFGETAQYDESLAELFNSVYENSSQTGYLFYLSFDELKKVEKRLQKEVLENTEMLGVYAYDKNFVRIYRDKAVFSFEEDPARYRERVLDGNEFERLKGYLAEKRVDELPPFLSYCYEGCDDQKELLMLGRNGGRRVFQYGTIEAPFFIELGKIFEELRRPPAKLNYYLQKNIAGLEILFENKDLQAETVWKNGADFRVLINNEQRREQIDKELSDLDEADQDNEKIDYDIFYARSRKRREMRAYENYGWFKYSGGRLLESVLQPPNLNFIPSRDQTPIQPTQAQWKARTATIELRVGDGGLFKVVRGQLVKIRDGEYFDNVLISPNGRWAITQKYATGEGAEEYYGLQIYRVNLLTGKEFRVPYKEYPPLHPIVFVPSQNKFLLGTIIYGGEEEYESEEETGPSTPQYQNFFWLDADTGVLTPAKKEAEPLAHQTFRALQAVTGKPDEFWSAIPDAEKNKTQIGIFNARTLSFKAFLTLPQIEFDSMKMWVDEAENKAYFAYEGHILAVLLK